ncbi:transporter [Phenylobacterium sp. J367]|uniref:transporter n=1 Tax=Phenylobacterium sp. J367 TaxID=2898435 RepID=UPI002150F2EC|nr:transporter [Phenylobacterium sp. J367]MCR5878890.1 transporter [Phenylobacterium sp. J367]
MRRRLAVLIAANLAALLLAALVLAALATQARAQDDGPRVYQLAPVGARNVTAFLVNKRGNELPEPGSVAPGADIDTDILVLRYAETFEIAGRPVTPFAILPFGEVRRTGAASSSGLGDIQLGGTVGLLGAPALTPAAYAAYAPGFGVQILGRVFFPTGAYDGDQPLNLGSNRAAFQVGLPTVFAAGRSYREPGLTSLEVLPTVTFYAPNEDPFGGARSEKDPFLTVEAHLTRTLGDRLWVSADLLYRRGGETETDGVRDANGMHGWSAGGSLALPFVSRTSLIFTWQQVIERSDDGPDGWFFRTALVAPF